MLSGKQRGMRMGSVEVVIGVALILGALFFGWAARPSTTGIARKIQSHPTMEPYYPILIMSLIVAGVLVIMVGLGVRLGQGS
jgi:hypothetical protein